MHAVSAKKNLNYFRK